YLFDQWGGVLAILAGVFWFGLLFFAGVTSSLAMGTPVMGFLQDEFNWRRKPAAWMFGLTVFLMGLPAVFFFQYGVFDEYDYWAGEFSLVVFALFEVILFAWIFGMTKGWNEINTGADIRIPIVFKYIIKFVTPVMLLFVFIWNLPGVWDKITNVKLYKQIAGAASPEEIETLNTTITYVNFSRIFLLLVFVGICYLVFVAYRKRMKEGRMTS
ncbi:MAG: sodium:calcium symporter, partial [Flavobacteriales bacterium]